jgi:hypothetical protein
MSYLAVRMRRIPQGPGASIGDFRRHPGCRLLIACSACGWSRDYDPERVVARLLEIHAGGETTPFSEVARRVAWNCPACQRMRWRAELAWPARIDEREARRLRNLHRN